MPAACASCSKRRKRSGSREYCDERILMATWRRSGGSSARQTSPMPPAPIGVDQFVGAEALSRDRPRRFFCEIAGRHVSARWTPEIDRLVWCAPNRDSTSRRNSASPAHACIEKRRSWRMRPDPAQPERSARPLASAPASSLQLTRQPRLGALQSRPTVSVETFRASAVSSRVSPPKNRSSTTCALRWSSLASS